MRGNNFVTKVLEWAKKSNEIREMDEQISNPT
jgi:dTDP-4-dehydrorhamnose reductase